MNTRFSQRRRFLQQCDWHEANVSALIPDASTRQYFRLSKGGKRAMLMDDIGGKSSVLPFIRITEHLISLNVRAPLIYQQDIEQGFLLLEDLGDGTFTQLMANGHDEKKLYQDAIKLISHIHNHPRATDIKLPPYDFSHFIDEALLLVDWYFPASRHEGLCNDAREEYIDIWQSIFNNLPLASPTLVLRDFHVDNLMLVDNTCAVLDYQDALIGPPAYDVVSLLEDARRDLTTSLIEEIKHDYFHLNPDINRPVFEHQLAVWGTQRHCKVAGIFVRLWLRDNKPVYLKHLKRVLGLIQRNISHPSLAPLKHWTSKHSLRLEHREFTQTREQMLSKTTFPITS